MQSGTLSNRIDRLAEAPRHVPLAAACASMMGIVGSIGAFFFSFGMIFVWVFGANMNLIDNWKLSLSHASAPGVVENVFETNATVNDENVIEYRFSFQPGDGLPVKGSCYTVNKRFKEGEHVIIHYVPGNPGIACIEGASVSMFPPWVLIFIMIFPAVGLSLFIPSIIGGWRKITLLRHGQVTGALKISEKTTNTRVNNQPVMEYFYEFRDRMGKIFNGSSKSLPTGRIGDEAMEPVLYLPGNPKRSILVDALPLKFPLEVDESGQWRHHGFFKPVLFFALAWGAVLIHVIIGILLII